MKTIYIGAGCFWGIQAYYQKVKGVKATEVGYANGPEGTVTYEQVCNSSGHAEVTKITFDPEVLTLQELFDSYIRIIDPLSLNKQGNDIGVQYRVGLYSEDQALLDSMKELLKTWENSNQKSVVEILPLINYIKAENNHQDYLNNNPGGYCHINLTNIPESLQR